MTPTEAFEVWWKDYAGYNDIVIARAAFRVACAWQREQDAVVAEQVWKSESDITKQNGLADGCLASAAAIRAAG